MHVEEPSTSARCNRAMSTMSHINLTSLPPELLAQIATLLDTKSLARLKESLPKQSHSLIDMELAKRETDDIVSCLKNALPVKRSETLHQRIAALPHSMRMLCVDRLIRRHSPSIAELEVLQRWKDFTDAMMTL
ncbi:hypothetical protein BC832DRAFT_547871 [Gaertneriomyces semiglobifer]|nr:hypothetical protein BC832DRAFT_547871 [Gaertneriomyces semiglobifer]